MFDFANFSSIDVIFRQAAQKNIVEAREGRAPMPLATYQNRKGIGAAVVEVARPAGQYFELFSGHDDPETENGRCGARDYSGTRRVLPLILADVGHEHVFAGWFDARWARVIVGGEIKKGARGLSWRHFDRFGACFLKSPISLPPITWPRNHAP